jgi:polygalacturonase
MAYAAAVDAMSISNVSVTSPSSGIFDGSTVASGKRVLLVGQTSQNQNGVWIFNGAGVAMSRPTSPDQYSQSNTLDNNTLIPVTNGNTYAGTCWGIDPGKIVTVSLSNGTGGTNHTLTRVALPPVQAKCATTGNINLASTWTSIDGVSLNYTNNKNTGAAGSDIVLVKDQTTASENGLYWANASGAMARCTEPLPPNRNIAVSEGTTNAHALLAIVTQGAISLGTTPLSISAQKLVVSVRDFSAKGDGSTDDYAAFNTAIASTSAGVVLLGPGNYKISGGNLAINSGTALRFEEGALLTPIARSVNVAGRIHAHPTQQIFSGTGVNTGVAHSSGAGPAITVSGNPLGSFTVVVQILLNGGVGTATFRYSLDNATTWSQSFAVASTFPLPGTGLTIAFPAGTYNGPSPGPQDQYTWTSTAAVSLTTNAAHEFSVKWWGAKGDGFTDDSGAIQTALNMTPAGSALLFPAGTYVVNAGLVIKNSNVTIRGVPGATIIRAQPGATFQTVLSTTSVLPPPSNLVFRDLVIDANKAARTGVGGVLECIRFTSNTDLRLQNVTSQNARGFGMSGSEGVAILNCARLRMLDCAVLSCGDAGNIADGTYISGSDVVVQGYSAVHCFDTGLVFEGCNNVTASNIVCPTAVLGSPSVAIPRVTALSLGEGPVSHF